jgi:hypothetical protein
LQFLKKIASILLLGILLFNWVGFRFFSSYMEQKSNVQLESRLDENNYDESQLISIKVPAEHLSFYTLSKQFERVDGQVEIKGVLYKYVKRRMVNDSLELLCIPNQQAMQLQDAKNNFFKLVNDLQHNGQGKKADSHPGSSKNFSVEYYTVHDLFNVNNVSSIVSQRSFQYAENLSSVYSPTAEQPPEYC